LVASGLGILTNLGRPSCRANPAVRASPAGPRTDQPGRASPAGSRAGLERWQVPAGLRAGKSRLVCAGWSWLVCTLAGRGWSGECVCQPSPAAALTRFFSPTPEDPAGLARAARPALRPAGTWCSEVRRSSRAARVRPGRALALCAGKSRLVSALAGPGWSALAGPCWSGECVCQPSPTAALTRFFSPTPEDPAGLARAAKPALRPAGTWCSAGCRAARVRPGRALALCAGKSRLVCALAGPGWSALAGPAFSRLAAPAWSGECVRQPSPSSALDSFFSPTPEDPAGLARAAKPALRPAGTWCSAVRKSSRAARVRPGRALALCAGWSRLVSELASPGWFPCKNLKFPDLFYL
jgi:hypothetical protein